MDNEQKILLLRRIRLVGLPLLVALALWLMVAVLAKPYVLHAPPSRQRSAAPSGIEYKKLPPVDEYLQVMASREMFKPSVLYETKKNDAVNVLGDLVFMGVIRNNNTVQAFIMNKKTGQSSFYNQGQALEDLVVKEIQDGKVVLSHGEETLELVR